MRVFVVEPGSVIRARSGGVVVQKRDGSRVWITGEFDQVIVASGRVSITAEAIRRLARMGVDIVFLDSWGDPIARVYPPIVNKTVASRIAQYEVAGSRFAAAIAGELVSAKIHNQAQTLKLLAKRLGEDRLRDEAYRLEALAPEAHDAALEGNLEDAATRLRSVESKAAKIYWGLVAEILPPRLGFTGRDPDGVDTFNITLNYGYGILYAEVERSLLYAGLDPYLGVMHAAKSGKPSLTLDLVEPFRGPVVERPLILAAARGRLEVTHSAGRLDYESRRLIASIVVDRGLRYKTGRRGRRGRIELSRHIRLQAIELARAFREKSNFEAFRVVY